MEEFKQGIYAKYLNTLSQHITTRFPDMGLYEGFEIFNPSTIPQQLAQQPKHGATMLKVLTDHYGSHNVVEVEATMSELSTFNSVVAANGVLKGLTEMNLMFPNLTKLASIGLLLPMSSVDCERGFSALSRVKTDMRNRLTNSMLNHLLMLSIEGPSPEEFPYDRACDRWAAM